VSKLEHPVEINFFMETNYGEPKQRARVSLLGFTNILAVSQLEHPVQINNFFFTETDYG